MSENYEHSKTFEMSVELADLRFVGGQRKLISSYDGPLVRLKRSSDGGEKNFWANEDGIVDEDEVLEWAGGYPYEIVEFFNQSEGMREEKDPVDHPDHYNQIPGIECIDVVEHFNFNRGNAIKYIWRADLKATVVENLQKAIWYLQREIKRIEQESEDREAG